jgi:Tfp pilus assembly protein PilF
LDIPNEANLYYAEAQKFKAQNNQESALEYYQKALEINPNHAEVYNSMGVLLYGQNKLKEALQCFEKAIEISPQYAQAYTNAGGAMLKLGNAHKALEYNEKALHIAPDDFNLHRNMGYVLHALRRVDEAEIHYQKTLQLNPHCADVWNNIGNVFKDLNKRTQAIEAYQKALEINPSHVDALNNLANTLKDNNDIANALNYYEKALTIFPDYATSHANLSLLLLLMGDFSRGWQEYEWRIKSNDTLFPQIQAPIWNGSPLNGRRLLVCHEQGLGDSIQFYRYLPLIQGGTVIFICPVGLQELCHSLPNENVIVMDDVMAKKNQVVFNVWIYLLSLPHIFKTTGETIPAQIPYLFANKEKIAEWKPRFSKEYFNIGIVWTGSPRHPKDSMRSCPLHHFIELSKIQEVKLYSLQKDKPISIDISLINLDNELHDFTDTAAVIECLDLVISVDTAVAHLAGAMGKPVWILLPFAPDWRWMLEREDSPWYPTMRLFRQLTLGDWNSVFIQVISALHEKLK